MKNKQVFEQSQKVENVSYSMYLEDQNVDKIEEIKKGNIPIKINEGPLEGMIIQYKDVKLKDIDNPESDVIFDFDILQTPYELFSEEYANPEHPIHEDVRIYVCSILLDCIQIVSQSHFNISKNEDII